MNNFSRNLKSPGTSVEETQGCVAQHDIWKRVQFLRLGNSEGLTKCYGVMINQLLLGDLSSSPGLSAFHK